MNLMDSEIRTRHVCRDRTQASSALAKRLGVVISKAIDQRDQATIVVSGGSSPVEMFSMLSQMPLPWNKVNVLVSDERIVPANHAERNERMISQQLLCNKAVSANLVSLIPEFTDGMDIKAHTSRNLQDIAFPFDAVVLGMGGDGHTASLFPDCPSIEDDLNSQDVSVIQDIARLEHKRLSLTPKTLLQSREINLLFFGDDKRLVFERAEGDGEISELPVRCVIHQNKVPFNTYWAP